MRQINGFIIIGFSLLILGCSSTNMPEIGNTKSQKTFDLIYNVYKWQLKNYPKLPTSTNWQASTFFIGSMTAYEETDYDPFIREAYKWSEENSWEIGSRTFNADDQSSAQVYLSLFNVYNEWYMIKDFKRVADEMIRKSLHKDEEILWWWADALFMAPPALAQLTRITNDKKYIDFLDQSWWETYNHLYSIEDSLFFRDRKYNNDSDHQGNKVFWLRGNGWAVAGLARLFEVLPQDVNLMENRYKTVYINTLDKLISLQSSDGLWRSSLLQPEKYPSPETSGSALVCYAIAWGVNSGLLQKARYKKAMLKCWDGLKRHVSSHGKLGFVQPVGAKPSNPEPHNSEIFGSGAFLILGSQMFTYYNEK